LHHRAVPKKIAAKAVIKVLITFKKIISNEIPKNQRPWRAT
jgi:hypothetical protein